MTDRDGRDLHDAHVRAFYARDPKVLADFRDWAAERNIEYEEQRRGHRVLNPNVSREQIAARGNDFSKKD